MIDIITSAAVQAAFILLPVLFASLFGLLLEKYGLERLRKLREQYDQKRGWTYDLVQAAQQMFRDNQEKYKYVSAGLAALAVRNKVPITEDEIQALIESIVKACKAEFGEAWAEAGEDTEAG